MVQMKTIDITKHVKDEFLTQLSKIIELILTKRFTHPVIDKLKKCYKKLPAITEGMLSLCDLLTGTRFGLLYFS